MPVLQILGLGLLYSLSCSAFDWNSVQVVDFCAYIPLLLYLARPSIEKSLL